MDEKEILDELTEHFYQGWDVMPTGGGFLVITDWVLPGGERIEIHIRRVGDREDLFVVSDGGELINFLFSQSIDLGKDPESKKLLEGIAEKHSIKIVDYQFARGAGESDIAQAIRGMLEAIKEASFMLWHKVAQKPSDAVH